MLKKLNQSCPWVGLTHGLGWVGLGRDFSLFVELGWIQQLRLCDGAFVPACSAAGEDILNISLKSLFFSDIQTLFLICIMISKKHE